MLPPNLTKPRLRVGLSRMSRTTNSSVPRPQSKPVLARPPSKQNLSARPPLYTHPSKPAEPQPSTSISNNDKEYFSVLYTKRSKKKRKSWLDGYVILTNDRQVQLVNEDGKTIASDRQSKPLGGLKSGNTLDITSWELEVQNTIREQDFISGRVFIPPAPTPRANSSIQKPRQSLLSKTAFKIPSSSASKTAQPKRGMPLHDPNAEGALVLLPSLSTASETCPIVLDPFLGRRMRPHQQVGVRFLFDCTAGRRLRDGDGSEGAILADDMGLGKSLQAIALLWTLIKQGPAGKPLAKKAIIVCPASLVRNWQNEIRKWLGDERLRPVALESGVNSYESKEQMAAFLNGNVRKLLIISYEMFRTNAQQLYRCDCGLIICDEGHRLKSVAGNKTVDALRRLPCRRRVILTGTPVQNDLEEFFAVCDFVVPGCFNSLASFRAVFASPIIASRDSSASTSTKQLGEARARELGLITSKFVLRRTSNILEKYLPPKHETAIFCRLQPSQEVAYEEEARRCTRDVAGANLNYAPLSAITSLRKICGHPALLRSTSDESDSESDENANECPSKYGNNKQSVKSDAKAEDSVKMLVTLAICEACIAKKDKLVLVSNFTSSLDLLQNALKSQSISYCRLDGSTAVSTRGDIVRRFNEGSLGDVFLLSAKAGGVGLNLIGASRLILFDPDWNPATDAQAMARVWRDGQKKHVFVYRLLCTGTIEEKIFQRQLFKRELHYAVDGDEQSKDGLTGGNDGNFNADDLLDIFRYNRDVAYCETLEVLKRSQVDWGDDGSVPKTMLLLEKFSEYKRMLKRRGDIPKYVWTDDDKVLEESLNADPRTHGVVSYLYTKKSKPSEDVCDGNQQVEAESDKKDCIPSSGKRVRNSGELKQGAQSEKRARVAPSHSYGSHDQGNENDNNGEIISRNSDRVEVDGVVVTTMKDVPLEDDGIDNENEEVPVLPSGGGASAVTWDDVIDNLET